MLAHHVGESTASEAQVNQDMIEVTKSDIAAEFAAPGAGMTI